MPSNETLETVETPSETVPALKPLITRYPDKHIARVVREYIRDGDIYSALLRAGYLETPDWVQERERADKLMRSDRFQVALEQLALVTRLLTLHRVATSEKGTAAMSASNQLVDSVTSSKGKIQPPSMRCVKWKDSEDIAPSGE